jgi:hypothetical protein
MKVYEYNGQVLTIEELSNISGIEKPTLRERIRRGYTIEEAIQMSPIKDSIKQFCESSWYEDWIGMSTKYLHEIYFKWCISNGYEPTCQQGFTRQILKLYPQLKTVPTRKENYCCRIIRER